MIICVKCKIIMSIDKIGVGADFGNHHVYPSDRYLCPKCGQTILFTNATPSLDPGYKHQSEYLKIDPKFKNYK